MSEKHAFLTSNGCFSDTNLIFQTPFPLLFLYFCIAN